MCNRQSKSLHLATIDELIAEIMSRCPGTANHSVSRAMGRDADKTTFYPSFFHCLTFTVGDATGEIKHVDHKEG